MWDKGFYIAVGTLGASFFGFLIDCNMGIFGTFSVIAAVITATIFNVHYCTKDKCVHMGQTAGLCCLPPI